MNIPVHTNGRIYDPKLGRFLQADPIVQAPKNSQNLNRYSYVLNNPLSYTDPTGYSFKSFFNKWIRPIAAIALTIWAPWGTGFWASVATGAAAGYVATGTIRGALIGAFSAAAFHGIGQHYANVAKANPKVLKFVGDTGLTSSQFASKIAAHAMVGGVMSELNGGKFGHGFLAAGMTQGLAPKINGIDRANTGVSAQRVIAAAVVGGTVSELTGGKFANGAVTGAFSRALNDEVHRDDAVRKGISSGRQLRNRLESIRDNPELVTGPERSHAQFADQAIYAGIYQRKTGFLGIFGDTVYSVPGPHLSFEAAAGTGFSVAFYALHTSHSGPGGIPSAVIVNYPRTTNLGSRVTNAVNLSEQIGNAPVYIDNGASTFSVTHTGAGYYSCSTYPGGGGCN